MSRFIRDTLKNFEPYQTVPIQHKYVINANESSYNLLTDPLLSESLMKRIQAKEINRYPDPMQRELKRALADYTGLHENQISASNGGDEVISTICHAFLDPGDLVLGHEPSFDIYRIAATIAGAQFQSLPDLQGQQIDIQGLIDHTRQEKPKMVFLCNPNNPTGYMLEEESVTRLLACQDTLIILDEAYIEFSKQSLSKLVNEYDNLIVIRTLSKAFGLAGMRVGYVLADPSLIKVIDAVRMPYNVGVLPQLVATFALENRDHILKQAKDIVEERNRMIEALSEIGVDFLPSETNFLLIRLKHYQATLARFDQASILIKAYGQRKGLENCIRITVTGKGLNDQIIQILKEDLCEPQA